MTVVTLDESPLVSALLELGASLPRDLILCIGGGLGLYIKQIYLRENPRIKTLFRLDQLPAARTTEDIDLFLQADVVTSSDRMRPIRAALDELGYQVVDSARYMQFYKDWGPGEVKIDLLVGPLGQLADRVPNDPRRVKPRPSVGLHASKVEEAIAIEQHQIEITLSGRLPSGERREANVRIPQAFTYLLMKLNAFADQLDNPNKKLGRHHAIDLYRIVGMLMESEDRAVRELVRQYAEHDEVAKARSIVREHFMPDDGKGRLRSREHELARDDLDLDRFVHEMEALLQPSRELGG